MQHENDKSQVLESRKHQILECCRIFGVPPNKVFDWSAISYNNLEQSNREFVTDNLLPYVTSSEQEIDFKLLTGGYAGVFVKYELRALTRGSMEDRSKYYETMIKYGALSINEMRHMEDLNPIGPDGDVHLIAANNMAPLEMVLEGLVGVAAGNNNMVPSPDENDDKDKEKGGTDKDDVPVSALVKLEGILAQAKALAEPVAPVNAPPPEMTEQESQLLAGSAKFIESLLPLFESEGDGEHAAFLSGTLENHRAEQGAEDAVETG